MTEEWRKVDVADWLEVSSLGRVRTWKNGHGLRTAPRLLPAGPDGTGYRSFCTRLNGHQKRLRVHREVCRAFHGAPPFPGAVVRHLDGDQLNNHAQNLAWGSMQDNADDRIRHGRSGLGELNSSARLTTAAVLEIRRFCAEGGLQREIAEQFGISRRHVSDVVRGQRWRHVA